MQCGGYDFEDPIELCTLDDEDSEVYARAGIEIQFRFL